MSSFKKSTINIGVAINDDKLLFEEDEINNAWKIHIRLATSDSLKGRKNT